MERIADAGISDDQMQEAINKAFPGANVQKKTPTPPPVFTATFNQAAPGDPDFIICMLENAIAVGADAHFVLVVRHSALPPAMQPAGGGANQWVIVDPWVTEKPLPGRRPPPKIVAASNYVARATVMEMFEVKIGR